MENIEKSRASFVLASVAVLCFFGGLATFDSSIRLPVLGIRFQNPAIFPWLLVGFWLYVGQRFISASTAKHAEELRTMLEDYVNSAKIVERIFPPTRYGLTENWTVTTRSWLPAERAAEIGAARVLYRRGTFLRVFEFSYTSSSLHVHFLDQQSKQYGPHVEKGGLGPKNVRYWMCLLYEFSYLLREAFTRPVIMDYYFPRCLALVAASTVIWWFVRHL